MADQWDPRNVDHRRFFIADVLGPLIIATGPLDLRSGQAVEDAARAWMLSLPEIPAPVLIDGVARLLRSCPKWMPKPEGLRTACADHVAERRRAVGPAAQALIAECMQCGGSSWERYGDRSGVDTVRRCGCHARSLALLAGLPEPIALPPAAEDQAVSA